jgi:hypothetical protein
MKNIILIGVFFCNMIHAFSQEAGVKFRDDRSDGIQYMLRRDRDSYSNFYEFVKQLDPTLEELSSISFLNQDDVKHLQELSKKIIDKQHNNYQFNINIYGSDVKVKSANKDAVTYFELSQKISDILYYENKRLKEEAELAEKQATIKKEYDKLRKVDSLKKIEEEKLLKLKHVEDSLRAVYEQEKLAKEQAAKQQTNQGDENFDEQRKKQKEELKKIIKQKKDKN